MAMTLKPAKGTPSKRKFSQNLLVIGLVVALILTVMITNTISSAALKDIVYIAVLRESLPKDGVITSIDQFEKVEMMAMEYERQGISKREDGTTRREVILWDDLPRIIESGGAYAGVYIPAGRPVYYSDLSMTGTQKNSYLYTMDGELLKLNVTGGEFGEMIVPGDKVNIRITYETEDYSLPTEEEYLNQVNAGIEIDRTVTVTEMLFSECSILDMLNGSGESIFDLYYELLSMPETERKEIITSDSFKSRTTPTNVLICVTAEEADRYAKVGNKGGDYLITLLPRDGTSEILSALDELKVGFARD